MVEVTRLLLVVFLFSIQYKCRLSDIYLLSLFVCFFSLFLLSFHSRHLGFILYKYKVAWSLTCILQPKGYIFRICILFLNIVILLQTAFILLISVALKNSVCKTQENSLVNSDFQMQELNVCLAKLASQFGSILNIAYSYLVFATSLNLLVIHFQHFSLFKPLDS